MNSSEERILKTKRTRNNTSAAQPAFIDRVGGCLLGHEDMSGRCGHFRHPWCYLTSISSYGVESTNLGVKLKFMRSPRE